jgi:hypothetical protein
LEETQLLSLYTSYGLSVEKSKYETITDNYLL